jgi:hypothetical protein
VAHYFVHKNARINGDHEVHREDCRHLPQAIHRVSLGFFSNCQYAMREAKKHFDQVNGCTQCSEPCRK